MKLFDRALQCCDPKKVHLALLDMYEKSDQRQLGNELLYKMTKKFKKSCKVLCCATLVLLFMLVYWKEVNYFLCNDRFG